MELQFPNKDNIIFCGDVHGNYRELGYYIRERYKIENSVIFVCGDFGMGFHKPNYYQFELHNLSEIAQKRNNVIISIRGNHDDPSWFNEINAFGQVYLIPDYEIVSVSGYNVIGIGGGISIDRKMDHRILGKTYWDNENILVDDVKLELIRNIDFVLTHSSPSFCEPKNKIGILYPFIDKDKDLLLDLENERNSMTKIYDSLKKNNNISKWFYGHFHDSYLVEHENVKFYGLDIMELKDIFCA